MPFQETDHFNVQPTAKPQAAKTPAAMRSLKGEYGGVNIIIPSTAHTAMANITVATFLFITPHLPTRLHVQP